MFHLLLIISRIACAALPGAAAPGNTPVPVHLEIRRHLDPAGREQVKVDCIPRLPAERRCSVSVEHNLQKSQFFFLPETRVYELADRYFGRLPKGTPLAITPPAEMRDEAVTAQWQILWGEKFHAGTLARGGAAATASPPVVKAAFLDLEYEIEKLRTQEYVNRSQPGKSRAK